MDSPICHMGDGAVNEGGRNPGHRVVLIHVAEVSAASTKGPGTNPGHFLNFLYIVNVIVIASTKGPGTNPGHILVCVRFRERAADASTKGPGTNPGHKNNTGTTTLTAHVPQRRDQEQIPVTFFEAL